MTLQERVVLNADGRLERFQESLFPQSGFRGDVRSGAVTTGTMPAVLRRAALVIVTGSRTTATELLPSAPRSMELILVSVRAVNAVSGEAVSLTLEESDAWARAAVGPERVTAMFRAMALEASRNDGRGTVHYQLFTNGTSELTMPPRGWAISLTPLDRQA